MDTQIAIKPESASALEGESASLLGEQSKGSTTEMTAIKEQNKDVGYDSIFKFIFGAVMVCITIYLVVLFSII